MCIWSREFTIFISLCVYEKKKPVANKSIKGSSCVNTTLAHWFCLDFYSYFFPGFCFTCIINKRIRWTRALQLGRERERKRESNSFAQFTQVIRNVYTNHDVACVWFGWMCRCIVDFCWQTVARFSIKTRKIMIEQLWFN